jgi:hypothetical protein
MKIKALCVVVGASLSVPGIAAADFSYDFFEAGYVDAGIDNSSIDGDGLRLEGSTAVADEFFVRAEYEDYDFDFNIGGSVLELGGGYFHPFSEDLDFIATGQYTQVELGNGDDDGIGIGGGVRTRLGGAFEVDALLNWVNFDDSDSDAYVDLRGRYLVNEQFAATLKLDLGSDTFDTMALGIRYNFRRSRGARN